MPVEVKNFNAPDETRPFEGKGKADVCNLAGKAVGRAVFEPGWKWSENVKPIAGTESCEAAHPGYRRSPHGGRRRQGPNPPPIRSRKAPTARSQSPLAIASTKPGNSLADGPRSASQSRNVGGSPCSASTLSAAAVTLAPFPWGFPRLTTRAPLERANSPVPSLEASSATTIWA